VRKRDAGGDSKHRSLKTTLWVFARALDKAKVPCPALPRTLRDIEQRIQGPVLVGISETQARGLAALLRQLANGKTLFEAAGLPEPRAGRPNADGQNRFYFAKWLRLRATVGTKAAAHAELRRQHPSAPSVARLDRWWNAQPEASRQLVIDVAEGRTYRRSKGGVTVTRAGPDTSKVLNAMTRGAKRGRF
jgi:hypothetical protein